MYQGTKVMLFERIENITVCPKFTQFLKDTFGKK